MRLAVTGANGFVGRAVVRHLRDIDFAGEVRLIDRAFDSEPAFQAVRADLTNRDAMADAVGNADCVIHLAALPGAAAWLMSAKVCAANLVHAALSIRSSGEALTLPALTVRIGDLVDELARSGDVSGISFEEVPRVRRAFGSHPPLDAGEASAYGLRSDGDLASLVQAASTNAECSPSCGVKRRPAPPPGMEGTIR